MGTMATSMNVGKQQPQAFQHSWGIATRTKSKSWVMKMNFSLPQMSSEKRLLLNLISLLHISIQICGFIRAIYWIDSCLYIKWKVCLIVEKHLNLFRCSAIPWSEEWQLECGVPSTKSVTVSHFNFQGTTQDSPSSHQTRDLNSQTQNRARRVLTYAKISTKLDKSHSTPQQQKIPKFKIGRLGACSGAISALAVAQGCLGDPKSRISARKGSGFA